MTPDELRRAADLVMYWGRTYVQGRFEAEALAAKLRALADDCEKCDGLVAAERGVHEDRLRLHQAERDELTNRLNALLARQAEQDLLEYRKEKDPK